MYKEEEIDYKIFDDNLLLFSSMIEDILNAKQYIYLEMYRFANDAIGKRFREALKKARGNGIEICLLLDAYGTKPDDAFFAELIELGVKINYFKKFKFFFFNTFARNHTRNHRKLLLIDDEITYIGSSNLTSYSLCWRDLNLRMKHPITHKFKGCFYNSLRKHKLYEMVHFKKIEPIYYHGFSIIQDVPSTYNKHVRDYILNQINDAQEEIIMETPYFLPGYKIRKALMAASTRGVKVKIFIPLNSDIALVDLLRTKYFGPMHKNGIEWRFFKPDNLHAKCLIFDKKRFIIGSSNIDYRSFIYQYEIMLTGTNIEIIELLNKHVEGTYKQCKGFDYEEWKSAPLSHKVIEWLITPFRRLF